MTMGHIRIASQAHAVTYGPTFGVPVNKFVKMAARGLESGVWVGGVDLNYRGVPFPFSRRTCTLRCSTRRHMSAPVLHTGQHVGANIYKNGKGRW